MNYFKARILGIVLLITTTVFSQEKNRIVGYVDANLNQATTRVQALQWSKMTDLIYGFVQPIGSDGTLEVPSSKPNFTLIKNLAASNNVKLHFSTGGADFATKQKLISIASNATSRVKFAKSVADILQSTGMIGFDLDWEFPTAAQIGIHKELVKAIHDEFVSRGKRSEWEIAIAVGGETPSVGSQGVYHTDYADAGVFQYLDYVNVMSYDIGFNISGGDFNHSSLADANSNMTDWNNKGCPMNKIVLGVPFYARHQSNRGASIYTHAYSDLTSGNPSVGYSSNNVGAYYYNGKTLLQDKVDLVQQRGAAGIMVWEITYDNTTQPQYSLLGAIYEQMSKYGCTAPDLGNDKSLCGVTSVTLDANLPSFNRTFSWTKDGDFYPGNGSSISVTTVGEYEVTVDSAGQCTSSDKIIVSADLPSIDLGGPYDLCSPASITLDAGISGLGYNYSWKLSSVEIGTLQTLFVNKPGTYSVDVSSGACSETGQVLVTSSGVDVEDQLICKGQSAVFSAAGSGDFEWYSDAQGVNLLDNGAVFNTPALNNTTTYYVKNVAAVDVVTGPNESNLSQAQQYGFSSSLTFDALEGFEIEKINVGVIQYGSGGTVTITVKKGNQNIGSATLTIPSGSGMNYYLEDINVAVPEGSGYELTSSGSPSIFWYREGVTIPKTYSDLIKFTSFGQEGYANSFPALTDWVISTGATCDPTPVVATVDLCTDISNEDTFSDFQVYPNPISGNVYVKLEASSPSKITCYNMLGELVKTEYKQGNAYNMNMEALDTGMYIIKITQGENTYTKRVIKN